MTLTKKEKDSMGEEYSRDTYTKTRKTATLNKGDIIAAAVALDTFITNNFPALNNALPEPFKSRATKKEKVRLFKFVVNRLEVNS